jgi:cytochrome c-type biogenesis protein CcmH/NrfG
VFRSIVSIVVLVLSAASATGAPDRRQQERSLAWAERLLCEVPDRPAREAPEFVPRIDVMHAAEAFEAVTRKYGESARGDRGLAACYMRVGQYGRARDLYAKALKLSPSDREARRGMKQAALLAAVSDGVKAQLPAGYIVRQVRRVRSANGRSLWACLTAHECGFHDWYAYYSQIRLGLYERTDGGWQRTWQSDVIQDPRLDDGDCCDTEFYVVDLTGNGMPEITVGTYFSGCSWSPCHLGIYRWRTGRLEKMTGFSSNEAPWMEDLNHDGRFEIGILYKIGAVLAECEKPRWTDIYAYSRGAYRLANSDFPSYFRRLPSCWRESVAGLRQILGVHPDDWEIWTHLAESYEILGRPKQALDAYRQAGACCASELVDEKNARWRSIDQRHLDRIQRHIATLSPRK